MPLTLDHEILTEDGWKSYKDIIRKPKEQYKPSIFPSSEINNIPIKPIIENDKFISLDINDSSKITESFVGELYLSKSKRVMYTIKNDHIDTIITEDHTIPYKFNINDNIKIDSLIHIIYNLSKNNLNKFYLINNESLIEVNKTDLIKNIIDIDIFSFITKKKTFYVRKNNLEFWTSF